MRYLLDTNILIAAIKGNAGVRSKLEVTPLAALVLSPMVLGELELGVAKSRHREKNAERLVQITSGIELVPLDAGVSRHYGEIRGELCQRPEMQAAFADPLQVFDESTGYSAPSQSGSLIAQKRKPI